MGFCGNDAGLNGASRTSSVFESLPLAIQWLRETAQQNQSIQFQVKTFAAVSVISCAESLMHDPPSTIIDLQSSVPIYLICCFSTNSCTSSLIHSVMYCPSSSESD